MGKVTLPDKAKPGPKSAKAKRITKSTKTNLKIHNFKNKKVKNFSNYFADPLIVPRVEDYLEDNKDKLHVDIDDMVDDMMKMYKEYSRKKRAPFKSVVQKAFAVVLQRHNDSTIGANLSDDSEEDLDFLDEDDEEEGEGEEGEEEDDDDDIMSPMEDEEDDEELDEDEEDLYKDLLPQSMKSNHVKRSASSSMFMNEKKSSQRNGTQELINISSDESDKEASKKLNSTKVKLTAAKAPVIATRRPSSPKLGSRSLAASANTSAPNQAEASLLLKRKQFASTIAKFQQNGNSQALEFPIKTRTCVKFSDVGGCSKVLKEISQFLLHLRHPEVYQYLGVVPPRGFLLHGPPGTGKTLVARAIAGELKLPLIQVAAPELIKGISGSSEERIRHLFDQAVSISPCILFLDEVDAITPRRDNAQREMERRIVAQLLSSMDELTTTHNGNKVLVIGATNRPDSIDPALRRAGRFDREICLGIPDRDARKEILGILTAKLRVSPAVSLDKLAASTPGYVGADLRALITEASIAAVERLFGDKDNIENSPVKVNENVPTLNEVESVASTKDEEMKDVSSVKENTNEEKLDDASHNSKGEPAAKIRKLETESSAADEIEILADISGNKEEKKDCAEIVKSSETDKPEEKLEKSEEKEKVVKEVEKIIEADVINVEDEETESKKEEETVEIIKISSLLQNSQPLTAKQLKSLVVDECDFTSALKVVQPSAKREGFATVPDVTWNDIGSLKHIRDELQMMIMTPVRYPAAFKSLGLRTSSGVLLCGPPGCGKTLVAKAVANEADINFISVKGPELLNMYVGESERAVRQCFLRARNSQPCVIFFDELDAICPKRSDGEGGASMRVVNQLLTEMDGVEGRNGVFIMGASNRPDIIDPAVLRPGRLDKILFVGLPSPVDRVDILRALTKNGTKPVLDDDVSLEALGHSAYCTNFTGADLSSLVHEAGVRALMEFTEKGGEGPIKVAAKHFQHAFQKIRPSVSEQDQKHYERLRLKYAAVPHCENPMEVSE